MDLFAGDDYLFRQSGPQVASSHGQRSPIALRVHSSPFDLDLLGSLFAHFTLPLQVQITRDGAIYLVSADAERGCVNHAATADDGDAPRALPEVLQHTGRGAPLI